MASPPARTEISDNYPLPSDATARIGFGKLYDYVTGLLGATGNALEARAALGAYGKNSILGTVSQSVGVPTGAVIERGSNANGEYVRFADGTQICTASLAGLAIVANSTGSISWTYPAAFVAGPAISASAAPNTSQDYFGFIYDNTGTAALASLLFKNGATAQSIGTVRALAVGRWF